MSAARRVAPPSLRVDMPAVEGFCAVLGASARDLAGQWQGAIDGADIEALHRWRVAVRRTRAVVGEAEHVLPVRLIAGARDDFGWLGGLSGPVRDLDVHLVRWDRDLEGLGPTDAHALAPVQTLLVQRHLAARTAFVDGLRSVRATELLSTWPDRVAVAAVQFDPGCSLARRPLGEVVAARLRRSHRRLLRDGRAIDIDAPAEVFHDLRKRAKKVRYLVESFGTALSPSADRTRFVRRLEALQASLGRHQDAVVTGDALRSLAAALCDRADSVPIALAVGRLIERSELVVLAARSESIHRFARLDRRDATRSLHRVLADLGD